MSETHHSRYAFAQTPNGFVIHGGNGRYAVRAQYSREKQVWVVIPYNETKIYSYTNKYRTYDVWGVTKACANILMTMWRSQKSAGFDIHEWARQQTRGAIGKRVVESWRRVLNANVPERELAIHRSVFSKTCLPIGYLQDWIFDEEYVLRDVLKYRAAAAALLITDGRSDQRELMREWVNMFSYTGKPYRALNKILYDLPAAVPLRVLENMFSVKFERPITDRLELLVAVNGSTHWQASENHTHIFMHATHDEIMRAAERVSRYLHRPLNMRRYDNIVEFVGVINDYHENHNGNLVGLAERAVHWHRDLVTLRNAVFAEDYAVTTAIPPIELPKDARIKFLKNVGEVIEEGNEMGHCIGDYAKKAVAGHCYLFHVEYAGETASVEVAAVSGAVLQSYGPGNMINKASRWGRRVLTKWGEGIGAKNIANPFLDLDDGFEEFDEFEQVF